MLNQLVIKATNSINLSITSSNCQNVIKALNEFAEKTNTSIGRLELILEIAQILKNLGYIAFAIDEENKKSLISTIDNCSQNLISTNGNGSSISGLNSAIRLYEEFLNQKWNLFAIKKIDPAINSINALRQLFDDQPIVIDNLLANLNRAKSLPRNKTNIKSIIQDIDTAYDKIQKLNLNPEVENFLSKIRFGNAKYSDLSENIIKWIEKNNMGNKLTIGFQISSK